MGFTTIDVWRVFPDKIKIKYPLFEISFFVQCVIKINIQPYWYSNGQHSKQDLSFKHPQAWC